MRPNRRWIAPAALTALAAATTTAAMIQATATPTTGRTETAAPAANTTSTGGTAARGTGTTAAATGGNAEIATTTLGTDLRVTLRAHQVGRYDALVDVAAFRHVRGAWRPAWHERVPGPWFYYPLTGRNAVCSLRVTERPESAPAVDVSLLVTPAVGCSPVRHFTVR